QAEDGIRDFHVTGVQTCALPIWPIVARCARSTICALRLKPHRNVCCCKLRAVAPACSSYCSSCSWYYSRCLAPGKAPSHSLHRRSEERRVGKGCRCRCG